MPGDPDEIEVHAYVEVCDLARALRFYVGGLGLREFRRLTPRWAERAISAGGVLDRDIVDHRYWRMANLADPSGNGVDLIELVDGGYEEFVRHTG